MSTISIGSIPSAQALEARFAFVKNQTLKTNLAIYLRYVILLLALSEESNLGSLHYSIYKDIVVYTASSIESTLEYAVREYIVKGKAKQDIFGYSWHYSELAKINHECIDFSGASFVVQKKESTYKTNSRDLGFDDINKAAKTAKIIDEHLYAKAEDLRKKRNLIHLSSLEKSSDDYIKKADVTKCLEDAKVILLAVETKLNAL
jgi:hypothetical protein